MSTAADVVCLDYHDLVRDVNLNDQIAAAFGMKGLGLLTVKNIPGFVEARREMLPLAHKFATLPESVKEKYIHEKSSYSFGWSHGKEKLQGFPDTSKGSYYANPQYDDPTNGDKDMIEKYSSFVHPNIWPTDDLPEFELVFKKLGQLIVSVGILIAQHCDRYVHSLNSSYPKDKLKETIMKSMCCKARLLHYFPDPIHSLSEKGDNDDGDDEEEERNHEAEFSSWCGWHNDHGSLTGLTSAMYLDENGNEVVNSDISAGLYIRNRMSELKKINIPSDHLAFQIGETAQIHSGGLLQATPHAVRGSKQAGISRETFAVFMEPNWFESMNFPDGTELEQVQSQSSAAALPKGVPPLKIRWNPTQTFGDFTTATLSNYY